MSNEKLVETQALLKDGIKGMLEVNTLQFVDENKSKHAVLVRYRHSAGLLSKWGIMGFCDYQ